MSPRDDSFAEPPFLAAEPPPLVARGLSYLLIGLFVVAAAGAITVQVPETVSGAFVLVPVQGTDPIRTPREGVVTEVHATAGAHIQRGSILYVIRSQPVGDRSATLHGLQAQLAGTDAALANARRQYESGRRADSDEVRRLEGRIGYLTRVLPFRRSQAAAAAELATNGRTGFDRGVISGADYAARRIDADRATTDLASAESDEAETRSALAKLHNEMDARAAQYAETLRQLEAARNDMRIRASALATDSSDWSHGLLTIRAPCDGTVLGVHVQAGGAIVQAGESLSDIACAGAPLRAEMAVPANGIALVKTGLRARLRYDAFPYQRFGARDGTVRWVGPATMRPDTPSFRALIDMEGAPFRVDGVARPLLPGMAGRMDVIIGRRSVASYIFEPLRMLRENITQGGR